MNTISLPKWLQVIDQEYLSGFIRDGGASVKIAVTDDELRSELIASLRTRCEARNYICIEFDAAKRRAHMPQDIFFEMAEQIDWRLLARYQILRLAQYAGLEVEGVNEAETSNIYGEIGRVNALEGNSVYRELRPHMESQTVRNPRMAKDFRIAMTHLCTNENSSDPESLGDPLLEWLKGRNTRLGNVRHFSIYTHINRNTARYFIESAFYWIHHVGYAGTVMHFDISRVTVARRTKDGQRYYTRAMAMDHYELLREFIDDADRLTCALLLVSASQEFLEDATDRRSRGYGMYQALQTRIMDDVRDRNLVNPAASLVRLTSQGTVK